jgi:hypothetical protein
MTSSWCAQPALCPAELLLTLARTDRVRDHANGRGHSPAAQGESLLLRFLNLDSFAHTAVCRLSAPTTIAPLTLWSPCAKGAWLTLHVLRFLHQRVRVRLRSAKRESEADMFNDILSGLKKDWAKKKPDFWKVRLCLAACGFASSINLLLLAAACSRQGHQTHRQQRAEGRQDDGR